MESVYGIILAAGAGRRMGGNKLLIDLGGRTVFETTLANHLESRLAGIYAVIPGWIESFAEVVERCSDKRTIFVTMAAPCEMSASLKAGWRRVLDDTDAGGVMISLGDQPLIGPQTLDMLIDVYRSSGKAICVPVHAGRRGHPVILPRGLDEEIMELTGDRGAREIIEGRRDQTLEIDVAGEEVLLDIDRVDDLEIMKARLDNGG
jgi:molybdenum cofactor cytidylyltransferase